jgi:predicted nucleotide-binding protein
MYKLIAESEELSPRGVDGWVERARLAIAAAYGADSPHLQRFDSVNYSLGAYTTDTPDSAFDEAKMAGLRDAVGMLRAFVEDLEDDDDKAPAELLVEPRIDSSSSNRVFVVHGHDEGVRDQVARLIERLDLEPIVLQEQTDEGRTIIEKFEQHALDVGYAVILLTADDFGYGPGEPEPDASNRARQNVILELGYFMGKLGRARTTALYTDGVELPSDIHGVLYIPLDSNWELKLAREMRAAGLPVDMNRLA